MVKTKILLICMALLTCSGCAVVSTLGTPTSHEKKIPAEFDLASYESGKIAIIVTGTKDTKDGKKARYYLSRGIKSFLIAKKIVSPENTIPYNDIYQLVPASVPSDDNTVVRIASQAGAKTVIKIEINKYKLEKLGGTEYYEGSLSISGSILDTANGQGLWPGAGIGKDVAVSFDIESKGYEAAAKRLANAAAHCITRYLYNCPLNSFKIYEESVSID